MDDAIVAMARLPADSPARTADLKRRTLSGLALATVALAVIWFGSPVFEVFILLATVIGALEWRRLCGLTGDWNGWAVVVMVAASVLLAAMLGLGPALIATFAIGGVLAAMATARGSRYAWSGIGIIYIGAPAALAIYLRGSAINGALLFLWIVAVVVATDVGAYAGGRAIGGPRLAPRVSPGKNVVRRRGWRPRCRFRRPGPSLATPRRISPYGWSIGDWALHRLPVRRSL